MTRRQSEAAARRYAKHHTQAMSVLAEIRHGIDTQVGGTPTWADVCEMSDALRTLQELRDRLLGRGEYAPENTAPTTLPGHTSVTRRTRS